MGLRLRTKERRDGHREYMRKVWYPKNKDKHVATVSRWKRANKDKVYAEINALKRQPCTDCKNKFPPICMDFDHLPSKGRKTMNISEMIGRSWAINSILKEIEKCELVCANCHRIRTEARSGRKRYLAA